MEDTDRIRWMRHVWQIEDMAWIYFLGMLPEYNHFETESAAWTYLLPTVDAPKLDNRTAPTEK